MGENIANLISDKELISKIGKVLIQINSKNTDQFKTWTKGLNRHLSKEDIRMAKSYIKCCSMSLIKEIQIKTSMSYHLIPVRMTVIKKTKNNTQGYGEKEPLSTVCRNVNSYSNYGKQ